MSEVQENLKIPSLNDFIDGERDAKEGKPANESRSEDYQRGYGFQYQMDELKSAGVAL